jgi:tyrosyl-tRNA synthetase
MKIPDKLLCDYFCLTTDIPPEIFESLIKSDIREAHFIYAREIVRMYHNENSIIVAEKRYKEIAAGKFPENIETIKLDINEINIVDLVKAVGFAVSNGDARRLLAGRGIKINGEIVTDNFLSISKTDTFIISKGKNKFIRVILS